MRLHSLAAFMTLGVVVAGCNGDDTDVTPDTDTDVTVDTDTDVVDTDTDLPVEEPVNVRLIHNIWDEAIVDVAVNGGSTNLIDDFPLGGNSGYTDIFAPGTYTMTMHNDYNGAEDDRVILDLTDITVVAGGSYTIHAFGLTALGAVSGVVLTDDNSAVDAGMVRIRPLNTRTGLNSFDIWVDGALTWDNLAYGTAGEYVEVTEGSHIWGFDVDGDGAADANCDVNLTSANFVAGTSQVANVSIPFGQTTAIPAVFVYVNGTSTDTLAQAPVQIGCAAP